MPVDATTHPQSADSRPRLCFMYMLVRWLRINARMVCSSVALMSFAKLTTGDGCRDALVAAAAVAHHSHGCAAHARIASRRGVGHHVFHRGVAEILCPG